MNIGEFNSLYSNLIIKSFNRKDTWSHFCLLPWTEFSNEVVLDLRMKRVFLAKGFSVDFSSALG